MTTEKIIYDTAIADGMPPALAELIVAQSKLESGNYKHRFFTIGHNAFGYSYDRNSKWQLDVGGPNADNGIAIAQYKNVQNSVHELTSWIKRRQKDGQFPKDLTGIKTPMQYTVYLRHGAHPYGGRSDQEYSAGIQYWLARDPIKSVVTGGSFLALLLVFFCSIVMKDDISKSKITIGSRAGIVGYNYLPGGGCSDRQNKLCNQVA